VLVEDRGIWSVGGIAVAAQMGVSIGFAVALDEIRTHL
jgi:hypothetical protein